MKVGIAGLEGEKALPESELEEIAQNITLRLYLLEVAICDF
jgi:hypothetical protein